ncbi:MAG: response regulator transcription factor [Phycisphaerales bacterium]|nr:response regulator transcription factor [Phycisphaerales bacterium]
MSTIRVLLVDDHALLRDTLASRLEAEADMSVVGVAETADEALDRIQTCSPDIILMDIDMPGRICFDVARTIVARLPDVRLIFLSAYFHDHYIEEALRVKALGYLTKRESVDRIVDAIRDVMNDRVCFSEEIQGRIEFAEGETRLSGRSRASTLTGRQVEVLRYIARGLSKKEIASLMHVSVKTVEKHTDALMSKLNIHDRVELARYAIREGLAEA